MRVETKETTTQITMCCEVEPEWGYSEQKCPGCGRWSPETIGRVTISREVVDE